MDNTVYTEGIIDSLKTAIRYDVNSGIDRPQPEYIDTALENLKRRFQMINKFSRYQAWTIVHRKHVTIYIPYKKMHEQLPRIMESLKLIRQELECLGNNVSINKIYNMAEFV